MINEAGRLLRRNRARINTKGTVQDQEPGGNDMSFNQTRTTSSGRNEPDAVDITTCCTPGVVGPDQRGLDRGPR